MTQASIPLSKLYAGIALYLCVHLIANDNQSRVKALSQIRVAPGHNVTQLLDLLNGVLVPVSPRKD